MGDENWRKVAFASVRSTDSAEDASMAVVGIQGLSDAMDCRNKSRGSFWKVSEVAILLSRNAANVPRLGI